MTVRFARSVGMLLAVLVLAAGTLAAAPADSPPQFAPVAVATVMPGSQTYTGDGQCTANFVFADGADLYIGQAAHCAGLGGANEVDGCQAASLPLGTPVEVEGADHPGTLVYSSWLTMQQVGESDPNTCRFNDLALVELHPDDHAKVNPSVPFFGGPVGLDTDGTALGETVSSYGSSMLRLGLTPLSPKTGASLGTEAGGWNHPVYTVTPGIPGDSGSGFLDSDGNALGVLSTLTLAPLAASNGVSDLHRMLEYLGAHTDLDVELVPGTEPFTPLLSLL